MPRTPIALALAFALALGALGLAADAGAQPIVEVQAGAQAPMPPQPMRFILANGAILVGTQVGGDAEWVMVQTATGVVQVRRAEIASMDYQTGQGAIAVVAPQPPPPVQFAGPPPRRRGRGLLIAGSIVFGISYGLTALVGVTAGQESPSALWFLLPVAGPVMWASTVDCGGDDTFDVCRSLATTFGVFIAAVETAGIVMLAVGLSMRASSDDGQTADAGPVRPALALAPVWTPGYQGLALRSEF